MIRRCKMSSPSPADRARPTADLFSWRSSRSTNAKSVPIKSSRGLRPKLGAVPGASLFLQAGQDLRIGGRQSSAQYQYTIQSENLDDLVKWGPILLEQMKKLHGFTEVNTDQQNNGLQASLVYDRATAARLGISPQTIDQTLYQAFGQAQVSTMYSSLNQYHVVMEAAPQFLQGPQGLDGIYLHATNSSAMVPLSAVAHYEPTTAPISVNHQGQFPAVTLSFNFVPGFALSDAVKAIQQMEQQIKMPETIHGSFAGTLQAFQQSLANEAVSDSCRAYRGLYRAGNALRKLHSSDHDYFHAAFGRRRRGARLADF